MATINVTTYGVSPAASAATNRTGFASAVSAAAAGDIVYIPDGEYVLGVSSLRSILLNKVITMRGQSKAGTILRIDPTLVGLNTSWRLLEVTAGAAVENMTLEGGKASSNTVTAYDPLVEHHSGVFITSCSDPVLRNVAIRNFEGDGLQIYNSVVRPIIEDCSFEYHQRSGMSFTPQDGDFPVYDAIVRRCTFAGITAQPIDNEHGPVYGCQIYENSIASGTNGYMLTMSGYALAPDEEVPGYKNRSKDWHVHHNTFYGGIFVIRADDGLFEYNTFLNDTTKPCFEVSRSSSNITFQFNTGVMRNTAGTVCVHINGTTEIIDPDTWYAFPDKIAVNSNTLTTSSTAGSLGVRAQSFVSVSISGNTLTGPGASASTWSGVLLRATIPARDTGSAVVSGNKIYNFGHRGVSVAGQSTAKLLSATIFGNTIANINGATAMTQGISLDDGTGALQEAIVTENTFGAGVTTPIANVPGGADIAYAFPAPESVTRPAAFVGLSFVGGVL